MSKKILIKKPQTKIIIKKENPTPPKPKKYKVKRYFA